ncbi:GAF domain-containing protein [Pseudopedobacter beijingensis]|uniref:GAF domain-containing protein n=1 Tax=Pseudopedobacter beijingensis TaxID=1207056 RepID=A0ABW4IGJ8_9SPHI
MSHDLKVIQTDKQGQYQSLFPQIQSLLKAETDEIANMANLVAALKTQFNWHWVGFYLVKNDELVLGPFQGPIACTRIAFGKGVCGQAWQQQQTLRVADVNQFPGHIACSSLSQSEIVVPIFNDGKICAVLDVDSEYLNHFDSIDEFWLNKIAGLL